MANSLSHTLCYHTHSCCPVTPPHFPVTPFLVPLFLTYPFILHSDTVLFAIQTLSAHNTASQWHCHSSLSPTQAHSCSTTLSLKNTNTCSVTKLVRCAETKVLSMLHNNTFNSVITCTQLQCTQHDTIMLYLVILAHLLTDNRAVRRNLDYRSKVLPRMCLSLSVIPESNKCK